MTLPRFEQVQRSLRGQDPQNLVKEALLYGQMATTCPAGQLTELEVSSTTKSSMLNPFSTAMGRGRGSITPVLCPFSDRCLGNSPELYPLSQ